jgi:hypothetical protein
LGAIVSWGTYPNNVDFVTMLNNPAGIINCSSGSDGINGPYVADGHWHQFVAVEDNSALDGVRRKLYIDGRIVGISSAVASITLAGATRFSIGSLPDGSWPFIGQIDGVFVCDYVLTADLIHQLYAKGSQALSPSPKNVGDHIEGMDAVNLYATFDTLDSQHQIDLAVA